MYGNVSQEQNISRNSALCHTNKGLQESDDVRSTTVALKSFQSKKEVSGNENPPVFIVEMSK